MRMNRGWITAAALAVCCTGQAAENRNSIETTIAAVTRPAGQTRKIDFVTDTGTWMSLDVSPDGAWLVFDLLGHIYRMPSRGGEGVSLTQDSGIAINYHPRISPDGRSVAFISDRAGQENLWVMNADGSDPRPVVLDMDARFAEPAWSPDGQAIIVTKRSKTHVGFYRTSDSIWSYPAQGGSGKQLVELSPEGEPVLSRAGVWAGNRRAQWPSPTPDGKFLYFQVSNFSGGNNHLMRLTLGTGAISAVTAEKNQFLQCCGVTAHPPRLLEVAPELSADGRYLSFARKLPEGKISREGKELNGRTALWVRDLHSGVERLVMDPIANTLAESHPAWHTKVLPGYAWSSDSKHLFLTQGGRIRRLSIDSGEIETIPFRVRVQRVISQQARGELSIDSQFVRAKALRWPATSPDGKRVVFEAVGKLWMQEVGGSAPAALTQEMPDEFQLTPSWSPDGRWVAFATWNDLDGGALWKVGSNGQGLLRLSQAPGRFLHPRWSTDGQSLFVSSWPREMDYQPRSSVQWQVLSLPAGGGPGKPVTDAQYPAEISYGANGEMWVLNADTLLRRTRLEEQFHPVAVIKDAAQKNTRLAVSPNGQRIAFWHLNDVYVTEIPAAASAQALPVIDPAAAKRLTLEGGYYPSWIDDDRLEFSSAGGLFVHTVASANTRWRPIDLRVPAATPGGTVALTDVQIVHPGQRTPRAGTIIVKADRIVCAGACSHWNSDRQFSLPGKFVLPGYIDTHAHHLQEEGNDGLIAQHRAASAAYLAYGVTTVFDPAVDTDLHGFSIGEMIAAGRIVGPITYSTGTSLTCGDHSQVRPIDSLEEAQRQVNRLANLGAPSIKDYKQCTRQQRVWLSEAARRRRVSLTSEASDFEYLLGLVMDGHAGWEHPIMVRPTYIDVARFFGQAQAHYSATMWLASDYPDGAPAEYWLGRANLWADAKAMRWHGWEQMAQRRIFLDKPVSDYGFAVQSLTARDIRHAGGFVTTGAHGELRGLDTHFEMWTLGASMSATDVLEAATTSGAHFLGLENDLGTIAAGKIANLVILDSNPLEDIKRTADIAYVMKAGHLYVADTLDEVWPRVQPYGALPWRKPEMERRDTVKDEEHEQER